MLVQQTQKEFGKFDMQRYLQFKHRQYKISVREAKRKSWFTFCEKTQDVSLFKYITGKASHYNDFIFTTLENSQTFDSYDDIARSLMSEHCNIDEIPESYHSHVSDFSYNCNIDFPLIGERELNYAFDQKSDTKVYLRY